jgi:hypothetical protein
MGADAFSEKTDPHTRGAMFIWAALQFHRVMVEYVEINCVNHPYGTTPKVKG